MLKEQHYICAYCMRSISNDNTKVKIEHYIPRSYDMNLEMEYNNLLAVCHGNEGMPPAHQTCDTRKGNQLLTINPQRDRDISTVYYTKGGKIHSTNDCFDEELNNILNLNYHSLVDNRQKTLIIFMRKINEKYSGKHIDKKEWKRLEHKFCDVSPGATVVPYCGIIWEYIKKKT